MATSKPGPRSVDEYIALQPEAVRGQLECVRSAIRKAVPGTEETISYRMPAFKLRGAPLLYFAGWKRHYSLYPATGPLVEAFKEELAGYEVEKGTIRFPLSQPVPAGLIRRIAKFRAKEVSLATAAGALPARRRNSQPNSLRKRR